VQNYARVRAVEWDGATNCWRCQVHDVLADRHFVVRARCVAHATGPWAEQLPQNSIRLRLTKGVHLVVDRQRLPVSEAVVMTHQRRILFAIPWGQRVILGTTDTDYQGPPEAVQTEADDVDYVLGVVNRFFPAVKLHTGDVVGSWAGLRPLIYSGRGGPSDISRAHRIQMPQPGWFDVAGGKLTTYRLIAQQVVDRVLRYLGRRAVRSPTAAEPLVPHRSQEDPSGILPPPLERATVEHCCRCEWAVHLDDVMLRRTSWHYYLADAEQAAKQAAEWMSEILGWDDSTKEKELHRYRAVLP